MTIKKGPDAQDVQTKAQKLEPGDIVGGHYRIEERIDEGGMAMVFRATNTATHKTCALKVLHATLGDRPEFVQLFAKEAKVSSVIGDNDHIVSVFDAGLDDRGIPFIVMELLEGETLERVLEHGPLSPQLMRPVLEHLSSALEQAHQAGVVHRDLKPSNLFITYDKSDQPWLKVMDFGIAKVMQGEALRTATHVGTPAYNAPEQMGKTTRKLAAKQGITIAANISPATDVWALGLLAYEMLTGDMPGHYWGVETLSELPMKVAFEELVAPSERAGKNAALLPAGFDDWFATCLRKNAAERYATAGEAIGVLLGLLDAAAVEDIDEDDLEQVSTRLHSSPVKTADQKKTRVKTDKDKPSEPPPLPRISSPAITVAGAPAHVRSKNRAEVSSAPPVVTSDKRKAAPGAPRFGTGAAAAVLLLAAAGAVGWSLHKKQASAASACDGERPDPTVCQEACDAGALDACHRLAELAVAGKGAEPDLDKAFGLYHRACGTEPVTDEAALHRWTVHVEAAGCEEGKCVPEACVSLAELHEQGKGGALKSPRAATALYKRVCRMGMDDDKHRGSHGCVGLGEQRQRAGQIEAARDYYATACEDGLSSGCVALGTVLERGNGEWRDEKRARQLYQKACDSGDLQGCTHLGTMVERGRGGWVKDEAKAVEHYARACDGGQMLGCVHLADAYLAGKGNLTRDAVRAVELFQRACDAGAALSCARLAEMHQTGQGGLTADEKIAFELNQKSCDGGSLLGCAQLGAMYIAGQAGLTTDLKEGRRLETAACTGGEPMGCALLGRLEQRGGTAEREDILTLFETACDGGAAIGCLELGEMLEPGDDADKARAAQLYEQACDANVLRACTNLANFAYSGTGGVTQDVKRSVALNRKACDGGDDVGCARLGLLYATGQGIDKDLERAAKLHARVCNGTLGDDGQKARCVTLDRMIKDKPKEDAPKDDIAKEG